MIFEFAVCPGCTNPKQTDSGIVKKNKQLIPNNCSLSSADPSCLGLPAPSIPSKYLCSKLYQLGREGLWRSKNEKEKKNWEESQWERQQKTWRREGHRREKHRITKLCFSSNSDTEQQTWSSLININTHTFHLCTVCRELQSPKTKLCLDVIMP